MPRLSLRRSLFYLLVCGGLTMIAININVHQFGSRINSGPTGVSGGINDVSHDNRPSLNMTKSTVIINGESVIFGASPLTFPNRPWFMKGGVERPEPAPIDRVTNRRRTPLFPHENDGDRIVEQLMFVPPIGFLNYPDNLLNKTKLKKILLFHGLQNWAPLREGRDTFLKSQCPVDTCEVTADRDEVESADAILFRDHVNFNQPLMSIIPRSSSQIWILYLLESPYHTELFPYKNLFNWTATYRHDSDVVAPYEKFVAYDNFRESQKWPKSSETMPRNFAANKTKKVAWFVSNCAAHNGRMEFAEQLGQHIAVDIYGACGSLQCPRTSDKCFGLLNKDYKFYLSFENSNCKDYITEKFFVNGLGNDVVPIVMGARREDYERAAPPHSFIYAEDFETAKDLAQYLHLLNSNDTMYNEYFRWKGTGEFINTYFWCRLCAMLHDDKHVNKVYEDINAWWRGTGTCVSKRWKNYYNYKIPTLSSIISSSTSQSNKQNDDLM